MHAKQAAQKSVQKSSHTGQYEAKQAFIVLTIVVRATQASGHMLTGRGQVPITVHGGEAFEASFVKRCCDV